MSSRPGLEMQLRVLAGQAPESSGNFPLRHRQRRMQVELGTDNDDEVTSLALSVDYDAVARPRATSYRDTTPLRAARPLAIELRREHAGDRHAKQSGLSVEWQSGDRAFDEKVYVDTPTTDAAVLAAVIGPEVRHAVIELFELGFGLIAIDVDGRVTATVPAASMGTREHPIEPDRAERVLLAFERILDHLPAVTASGEAQPSVPLRVTTRVLGIIGLAGVLLNVGYVGLVLMAARALRPRGPAPSLSGWSMAAVLAFGVAAGWLGARLYGEAVTRRVRGRSDAHGQVLRARLSAFGGFAVLSFTAALLAVLLAR